MAPASGRNLLAALLLVTSALPAPAQCFQWSDEHVLGVDLNTRVLKVLELGSGPELYLGGDFQVSGSTAVRGVARWTGSGWTDVGAFQGVRVTDIEAFDDGSGPKLHLINVGYSSATGGLFVWDGASWQQLEPDAKSIHAWDDGTGEALYVRPRETTGITTANGTIYGLARWDGSTFTDLGLPYPSRLTPHLTWDDGAGEALYLWGGIGNDFGVWRYDGSSFTKLGSSFGLAILSLAVHDDGTGEALYAGGEGAPVNNKKVGEVWRFDGSDWVQVGPDASAEVKVLCSYDAGDGNGTRLYAGGSFQQIGGAPVSRVARWDGQDWQEVAGGVNKWVGAMVAYNDGSQKWPSLWMAGALTLAAGAPSNHVAELENPCAGQGASYCTAGTTANGCTALISSTGTAGLSTPRAFTVDVSGTEGGAPGVIFFGTSGEQANPWGNGTSWRCVVPPVVRTGLSPGIGTSGFCDGAFQLDFDAWMASHPPKAPLGGQTAYFQCWFRDPGNTSNQVTSFSDALRVTVCP